MSTPRPLECKCGHKEDEHSIVRDRYCMMAGCACMCFDGVAAPLEPTREIEIMLFEMVRDFCAIGRKYRVKSEIRRRIEAYAAAVSKNLQEELARAEDMIRHYLGSGYLPRMSAEEAREWLKEIAALRETK